MAFTVETGTGTPDANAYDSVENIDTFHADQGATDWGNFTTPEKEQAAPASPRSRVANVDIDRIVASRVVSGVN